MENNHQPIDTVIQLAQSVSHVGSKRVNTTATVADLHQ
jgi:hypothetical protein